MAIPPNDSGLRASEAVAAGLSADQLAGSWRKKLRWWRFNADVRGTASDVPESFWEPTSWAWLDGRTEITRTTALTGQPTTAGNVFFAGWFSPEGVGVQSPVSGILGLLHVVTTDVVNPGNLLSVNRVAANAPVNRFAAKDQGASVYTTETEFFNASAPVNPKRYFIAIYLDLADAANSAVAIFTGTQWIVLSGGIGGQGVSTVADVFPIGFGRHNTLANTRWWGRVANLGLAFGITPLDLTVPAVRNALLVDPGAAGAGYGVGTLAAYFRNDPDTFNAGSNAGNGGTFDSVVDGLVAASPYTQRRVSMDGTQARQIATLTGLPSPITAFTYSTWFKITDTAQRVLFAMYGGTGGTLALNRQAAANSNKLSLSLSDTLANSITVADGVTRSAVGYNDGALHHVYFVGSLADEVVACYIDGVYSFGFDPVAQGFIDFSDHVGIRIGESAAGANKWLGSLGDSWFAATYLDPATHLATFYNGGTPPLLTGRNHAVGGVEPLVLLGQGMNAGHWTGLKNLGTGGAGTVTGTFVLE